VVVLGLGGADVAHAEHFNIPAGRLGEVAGAVGVQGGVTIAVTDPEVAARRSPGVRGDLSVPAALDRALRGTGATAIFYDPTTIRIVARAVAPAPARRPQPQPQPPPPAPPAPPQEVEAVVVTASKQQMLVDTYPGSVKVIPLDAGWVGRNAAEGTAAITKLTPSLGSTNLGPGRDKLFIRGIADSSFSGPTQATVGQYLGDVRLNYNAPDPDLNLYDMKQIEVLVGPQGALYGASSLGGVIRLVPNAPDTHAAFGTMAAGVSTTRFGGTGGDGAVMVNLPLVEDRFAVRYVASGGLDAGYIDAPARGLRDINSTRSSGQRITWRVEAWSSWTFDLGLAFQNIATADGQYTLRGDPPLTRDNLVPQPFRNTYRLVYIAARGQFGDAELVTTTSMVRHKLTTVFDATGRDGSTRPQRFKEDNDITMFIHETRVSGGGQRSPWVVGVGSLFNFSVLSRELGPVAAPARIAGVVNAQAEVALFGQGSRPLTDTLTGTVGGRLTFANSTGFLINDIASGTGFMPVDGALESSRNALRFSGALALDWRPPGPLSVFFHYQQGYRAGGLAVAPSGSTLQSQKFVADDLNMNEVGVRLGRQGRDRLTLRAAVFAADWNHIQADLIDSSGLPYTTNVGRGRIFGLDGELTGRLSPTLTVSAAAFLNGSTLRPAGPEFSTGGRQTLPNVARDGARFAATWRRDLAGGVKLESDASLRYVGESKLGVGPQLDISQGDYWVADAGARLDFGGFAVSLDVANLGDVRANTFAFGNPFGLAQRDQMTPLRPRTVRLGIDTRF
jgi:outer membrane receptor protein involved in Fe transport